MKSHSIDGRTEDSSEFLNKIENLEKRG